MEFLTRSIIETFLLVFGALLSFGYIAISLSSLFEVLKYKRINKKVNFEDFLHSPLTPSISIIAPAYNEEEVVIDGVRSLLSLRYSNYDVIIINDGSSDRTLEKLVKHFKLEKVNSSFPKYLKTAEVRGVYKSTLPSLNKLTVIDKKNGQAKADASNVGLNYSESDYVLCCDIDSILEPDTLLKLIKPVLEQTHHKVIAVGGFVRVANGCKVSKGKLVKVQLPKNIWARIQVLEYMRSFLFGRMFWTRINGLMLVSGALGIYERKIVIESGGYDPNALGEDLELIVRMRQKMGSQPHKVIYIPETLCWTEVPESLKQLHSQRVRWIKGMIYMILKYRKMIFKKEYQSIGFISLPYSIFFEWLPPFIEAIGIVITLVLIVINQFYLNVFLGIFFSFYLFYLLNTILVILMDQNTFKQYVGWKNTFLLLVAAALEPIIYHPIMVWYALKANVQFFLGRNNSWGEMKRKGFE